MYAEYHAGNYKMMIKNYWMVKYYGIMQDTSQIVISMCMYHNYNSV